MSAGSGSLGQLDQSIDQELLFLLQRRVHGTQIGALSGLVVKKSNGFGGKS
jgi:hypothetical protein